MRIRLGLFKNFALNNPRKLSFQGQSFYRNILLILLHKARVRQQRGHLRYKQSIDTYTVSIRLLVIVTFLS